MAKLSIDAVKTLSSQNSKTSTRPHETLLDRTQWNLCVLVDGPKAILRRVEQLLVFLGSMGTYEIRNLRNDSNRNGQYPTNDRQIHSYAMRERELQMINSV